MLPGMAQSPDETTGLPWYRGLGPLAPPLPTEHTCCVCTVTMGRQGLCPHQRGQDPSTPKYKWAAVQDQTMPRKDSKGNPQVAGLSVPGAAQKWKGGGRTRDFCQDSEPMHHQGWPLECSPQSHSITTQHVAEEVKPVQKPSWWSGTHTVTHRQLTLPQHKEDNKDDLSFWVTTASKLWVGCPSLMSLSLFLFTKQRSSSGETEAVRCADKSPPNRTTYWRERGQEFSASNTAKVELLQTAPG